MHVVKDRLKYLRNNNKFHYFNYLINLTLRFKSFNFLLIIVEMLKVTLQQNSQKFKTEKL